MIFFFTGNYNGSIQAWRTNKKKFVYSLNYSHGSRKTGGLAQLARAPALHAGGQRFESVILHVADRNTG